MIDKSPLEPRARIASAKDEAANDMTALGVEGADKGVPHPVETDQPGTFFGELDDYLYSVSEEEGV